MKVSALLVGGIAGALALAGAAGAQTSGSYVARAADCVACHSAPDGKPFAGGLKMGTPLGNIYSTNITPDRATGIGAYSLADFERALRKGVARDGHHLYPAMPYPSYAKLSDADVAALYDYFMHEVDPVAQKNRASDIKWPLNMRWPLAIWNMLFLDGKPYAPDPGHDAAWNRGAYLVQGAGHCGACHTPRGVAFQEKAYDQGGEAFLAGAVLDGWTAPSLRGDAAAGLGRWSGADVVSFLKHGGNAHASVFGPMIDIYNNSSQYLSDGDLAAIATYLKSLPSAAKSDRAYAYDERTAKTLAGGDLSGAGAGIYGAHCASCHGIDGKGRSNMFPPLAGNPNVLTADASSIINVVLNGSQRTVTQGEPGSYRMAPYRLLLDDQQIADLTNFLRRSWGNGGGRQGEPVTAAQVAKLRTATDMSSDRAIILQMR